MTDSLAGVEALKPALAEGDEGGVDEGENENPKRTGDFGDAGVGDETVRDRTGRLEKDHNTSRAYPHE